MATLIFQPPATCFGSFNQDYIAIMADKQGKDSHSFFKGEFSFVNKDAQNIDSKDHNAAVSWHVMNRYERFKKQEQAKQLRASANVPVGPLSPPQPTTPVRQASPSITKRRRLTPSLQTAANVPSTPFGFDPWTTGEPLQLGYPGPSQGPSSGVPTMSATSTPSTRSSLLEDPFAGLGSSSAAVSMQGTEQAESDPGASTYLVSKILTFAYEYLLPQTWPDETGKNQWPYETARGWDDAAAMTQDQCYSNAYLAFLAAAMADRQGDTSLTHQARAFQGQAMSELRQRVSRKGPQELLTFKAVLKLFSSETIIDNTAVARVHLKMLRNLLTAAGGVILLDSWFREDLLSCDCYFALKYGTRPLFPAQEWTPGPLSQPWRARLVSAGIYGDHAATVDNAIEHPILKAICTDLRELFKAQEYIHTHDVPSDDQLLRWRQLRKFDCISRLGDHYVNVSIYPHLYDKPATQSFTTLAAALLTNMILGSPEPCRYGTKLLKDLKKKLVESETANESPEEKRLRLWAAYVGSLGERVHPVETETWFRDHMRATGAEMEVEGWEDAEKIFKQFLYSKNLHDEIKNSPTYRQEDFRKGLYGACGTSWRQPLSLSSSVTGSPSSAQGTSKAAGKRRAEA